VLKQQGQVYLTDTELAQYDGTDPTKPIYLALNGTIYDVSSNPDTYGPGGSYHFFAGRDAARAFLTGCFQEDQTPDLRGVEEMYIPIDPEPGTPEADKVLEREKKLTKAERKNRHAKELREAKKKIKEGIEHWAKLFRGDKGKPYHKVGTVVREDGWLEKLPKRELCEAARKNRPVRKLDDA
jgi:predicted heme/steroid binding protein